MVMHQQDQLEPGNVCAAASVHRDACQILEVGQGTATRSQRKSKAQVGRRLGVEEKVAHTCAWWGTSVALRPNMSVDLLHNAWQQAFNTSGRAAACGPSSAPWHLRGLVRGRLSGWQIQPLQS